MIIVSQDKEKIVNFDNVNMILVREKKIISFDNTFNSGTDDGDLIGVYETKERAKEVLKEIYEFYEVAKRYECSSNNGLTIFLEERFVYEMPKE